MQQSIGIYYARKIYRCNTGANFLPSTPSLYSNIVWLLKLTLYMSLAAI